MPRLIRHVLISINALMLLMLCFGPAVGQKPGGDLLKQRLTVKLDDVPFITVVATLSLDHRIPIGLELGTVSYDGVRRNFEATDKTPEEILDLICLYWPAYRWEVKDGVVNVIPAGARDSLLEHLLSTRISHFSPRNVTDKFELRNAILDLPEVKSFLDANGVSVFRLGNPVRHSDQIGTVELSVSDTDVKGILNKIIRDSDSKFWTLGRRSLDRNTIYMSL
jgi:hypothetical protein